MPDTHLPAPFEAYTGSEPYIFVSYAHQDSEDVFPDISSLHREGYRIWYDEGIDPGNEWPEEVAKALANTSLFLVFISENAVASRNVRNEINYALNHKKALIAVHLAETPLPPGLELRMGDIQAVLRYRMAEGSYWRKLVKAFPVNVHTCVGDTALKGGLAPNIPRVSAASGSSDATSLAAATATLAPLETPVADHETIPKTVAVRLLRYSPVTQERCTTLLDALSPSLRQQSALAILAWEVSFENREILKVLKEPRAYDWAKHLLNKLEFVGVQPPANPKGLLSKERTSVAGIIDQLQGLANEYHWTQTDAAMAIEEILPDATPVVVQELLSLNDLSGGHVARYPAWYMQAGLSEILSRHPTLLALNAMGTIIRFEHIEVTSALVSHLLSHSRAVCSDTERFEAWFASMAERKYSDFKNEHDRRINTSP